MTQLLKDSYEKKKGIKIPSISGYTLESFNITVLLTLQLWPSN